LDPLKEYLHKRMLKDNVFNGERLLDEIRQMGYTGGKTILKDYIKPFRDTAKKKCTVHYETLRGEDSLSLPLTMILFPRIANRIVPKQKAKWNGPSSTSPTTLSKGGVSFA
jgi:hypothetical protein